MVSWRLILKKREYEQLEDGFRFNLPLTQAMANEGADHVATGLFVWAKALAYHLLCKTE
jgi:hypothetical protein